MLDQILKLLSGEPWSPADEPDALQVAVAALLVEAARMDSHFDAPERAALERLLAARFGLDAETTRRLLDAAERAEAESTQLFRFTHLIVQRLDAAERIGIIEMLWEVAYADVVLAPEEDALVRRVAGLIYVSDKDRGDAKMRVLQRLGRA